MVDNVGGGRVWGPSPPIDAVRGQNVHGFRNFFSGAVRGMLPMGKCCRFQCCQLPMRRQGRRDDAEFYHAQGDMTRKIGEARYSCGLLRGGVETPTRSGGRLGDRTTWAKSTGRPVDKSKKGDPRDRGVTTSRRSAPVLAFRGGMCHSSPSRTTTLPPCPRPEVARSRP